MAEIRNRSRSKDIQSVPQSDDEEVTDIPGNPQLQDTKALPQGSDKTTEVLDTALKDLTPRWRNWIIRGIFTWLMIFGFFFLVYLGPLALVLTIFAIQIKCFHEIITIGYTVYKSYDLPWFRTLSWYFLFTSNYFFYGESLIEYFGVLLHRMEFLRYLVSYHRFISFSLYIAGFVGFVFSLVKKHYVKQFTLFGWTHVTLLIIVTQSHLIIHNVFEGLIWLLVPVSMIICNDIMAYMFGFFFGKTPLIQLSPKKTWEGFIGGAISTVFFGFLAALRCYVRQCAKMEVREEENTIVCGVGHYAKSSCGLYKPYPKETVRLTLRDCDRDVSRYLQGLKLSGGRQTICHPAADSEGSLISYRIGLFSFDPSITVCPYHRYTLGIQWKPSRKCCFPSHKGMQKPQRAVSKEMSQNILHSMGVLVVIGEGICLTCMDTYKKQCEGKYPPPTISSPAHVYGTANEIIQEEEYPSSIEKNGHQLQLDPVSDGAQSSQNLSQASNWSTDEITGTLTHANDVVSLISNGQFSPLRGQLHTSLSKVKPSTMRYYKRKAEESTDALLNLFAPGQSKELKLLISPEPERPKPDEELKDKILKLYGETSDNNLKVQLLSVVAKTMTKDELLQSIPGLTVYKIDQARLLGDAHSRETVKEKMKTTRQRMDAEKMQHALGFFFDPSFMQIVSYGTREMKLDSGEKITIPDVVRTLCHSHLVDMYVAYCKETNFQPLGRTSLFHILRVCAASKRKNLRGLDNITAEGVDGYTELHRLIDQLKDLGLMSLDVHSEISTKLTASRVYMKTDYKLHVEQSSLCADHCIDWSLSDPSDKDFQNTCQHKHTLKCDRCELIKEVELQLNSVIDALHVTQEAVNEYKKTLGDAVLKIYNWKAHIVRTVNQDQFRLDALENMKSYQALIIMDWAMKFLPIHYREKQSDWFGQRGKNWHVIVCIFKDAEDLCHRTYCHVMDSAKQDWFTVSSLLENALDTIKKQMPFIKEVMLRSDNAGCYHCGPLWFSLPQISQRTGISITEYCYSEPQAGKSYCDSKIAHMRMKMKSYAASGHNILTAADMKHALDAGSGVKGCQVANVAIDTTKQLFTMHKMKNVNNYSSITYQKDGMIVRKAYSIGRGLFVSNLEISKFTNSKHQEHTSGCLMLEDFVTPAMQKGEIRTKPSQNADVSEMTDNENDAERGTSEEPDMELFHCPEVGCSKKYSTYRGLENHLLCGKHHVKLDKKSTYDQIKLQWAQLCSEVVITCKNVLSSEENVEKKVKAEPMGWGLKKPRKSSRFPEKVRAFLTKKYEGGEKGRKANPSEVAEEMRVITSEDGSKVFSVDERLSTAQITSFFSRMASKGFGKASLKEDFDDSDLLAALAAIEEDALIENINYMPCK